MKDFTIVKNPLTVISIFAGLAEVAGIAVLPFVADANQVTYIWFLMLFPVFLVSAFFLTLNLNTRVLYAPSDFQDEKNYMDLFRASSTAERIEKLEEEVMEQQHEEEAVHAEEPSRTEANNLKQEGVVSSRDKLLALMKQDAKSRYMLAENLIIDRLAAEFRAPPRRDVALENKFGSQLFDAAFEDGNGLVLVEVKVFTEKAYPSRMRETFTRIQASLSALPESVRRNARFLLAFAYEMTDSRAAKIEKELKSMLKDFAMRTEVRMYPLQKLVEQV